MTSIPSEPKSLNASNGPPSQVGGAHLRDNDFQRLAASLPGFVYLCLNDESYTILYLSDAAERILGYPVSSFLEKELQYSKLIHPDDLNLVVNTVNTAAASKTSFHMIYRVLHGSGQYRWVEERGAGNYNGDELESLQGFITDVTDQVRQKREQQVFADLGHKLSAADTMEKLGQAITVAVSALWSWDAFLFSIPQSGEGRLRAVVEVDTINGEKKWFAPSRYDAEFLPAALRDRKPVLKLRDDENIALTSDRFGDLNRPSMSLMYAPVIVSDKGIGLLSVQSYTRHLYNEQDLALLQRLADFVAPVVERCRAEERNHAFSVLGEQLSKVSSPQEAANVIVDVADKLIGWDACAMYLYTEQKDLVTRLIAYDEIDGRRTLLPPSADAAPGAGMRGTMHAGKVLILREPDEPPDVSVPAFGDTARRSASLLWVSLRGPAGVTGFLSIQSYSWKAYDENDLQLLQALADHCSSAVDRARAQQALENEKERYRYAIHSAGAVPYEYSYLENRFAFVGEGIERITGWKAEEFTPAIWKSMIQEVVVHGTSQKEQIEEIARGVRTGVYSGWKADIRIVTRFGETRWVADTSIERRSPSGQPSGSLGILQDITERKSTERKLLHDALHDSLTGLANRALLLDHLQQALYRANRRDTTCFAILFIDIDRFKNVNDSLGHLLGDQLLVTIARRLEQCVRPGDTVARFAGDEFVLLLDDMKHPEDAIPVIERVLRDLSAPKKLEHQEVATSASIGIAFSAPYYTLPEELLRDADTALYRAKANGRGRYEIFNAAMRQHAISVLELENDLRRALDRGELLLHYQPIVDLSSGHICRFEALLRWQHPSRGMISPAEIIPVAEETGLIVPVGYWVMEEAASQIAKWRAASSEYCELVIAVNLSVRQLDAPDLFPRIMDILHRYRVPPSCFRLEITESAFLESCDRTTEVLLRLKAEGIGLSMDDFGTGYSSLSYLHRLPIDTVKIDRSFISKVEQEGPEREIVRSIILLTRNLRFACTAEGIETAEQLKIVKEMGCHRGQGYYFAKPLPAQAATELLGRKLKWE